MLFFYVFNGHAHASLGRGDKDRLEATSDRAAWSEETEQDGSGVTACAADRYGQDSSEFRSSR